MRTPSQTVLYGEVLTSEQLYYRDLAQLPVLTEEQRHELVERGRSGEREVRSQMVCAVLPLILPVVKRYTCVVAHADFLDLCQIASLEVLEVLERDFDRVLEKDRPFAYLKGVAALALVRYLQLQDMLIMKKGHSDYKRERIPVTSLDRPVERGSNVTLADVLADVLVDESFHESAEECPVRYEALYHGIGALTDFQRGVIERHYGLNGHPQEMLCDIDVDLTGKRDPKAVVASHRKQNAVRALRRQLEMRNGVVSSAMMQAGV